MSDKKVKISNILGTLIPDFIQADNPLFKEFLTQYYESEEREYGSTYLSENLPSFKEISTLSNISLVENQTVTLPNSTKPISPITLTNDIFAFDDVIDVSTTEGFPDKYGLLKINDEIITYTSKTSTSFLGCVRGFSGISNIKSVGNPEFLIFSETEANSHDANTVIINLGFIFISEFYKKFKRQFLVGLEEKQFTNGLNVENILSRARDFYGSKGTDTSLKILFQILFGKQVDVIKPFDYTIMPSEADWDVTDDIIVETLVGDPTKLIGLTIYENSFINPTATGSVSNVEFKFIGNKKYYKISFSKDTITNGFTVPSKTKVLGAGSTTEVITVDSTIGFGEDGNFFYKDADNIYRKATYTSKSSNQFFGCVGITTVLVESDLIIDGNSLYGYEDNDLTKICQMRLVGSISEASDNKNTTKYFDDGDSIRVKHLGEKVELDDKKFNTWFYNNLSYIDAQVTQGFLVTKEPHFLKKNDIITIIPKQTGSSTVFNFRIDTIANDLSITAPSAIQGLEGKEFVIKKIITYASNNFGIESLLSNIQNTFLDNEKNTYVSFSGYPSFSSGSGESLGDITNVTDRSQTFSFVGLGTGDQILDPININDHNFVNGERVHLTLNTTGIGSTARHGVSGVSTGYYYVNVVDTDNIRLSASLPNLYNNKIEIVKYTGEEGEIKTLNHIIKPAKLYDGGKLKNQNNFKRIFRTPKIEEVSLFNLNTKNKKIKGAIGVTLNGIELHSPISNDSVYYGQINHINVANSGSQFNVANPPSISITDDIGSGCISFVNFSGKIEEVFLNTAGFDYPETPVVTITGGNGSGAVCEAKMRGYTYSKSFIGNDIDISNNKFLGEHRFSDGEEVTYSTTGNPIGINTGVNVGFTTDLLSSNTSYFVAKIDENSFSLAINKNNALNKSNLIEFLQFGTNSHIFTSKKIRKKIDRISILNAGSSYSNKRVSILSQEYPPSNKKDVFRTFVGINTFNNYIYAKNHNFKNGDNVEYTCTGTEISGLSTSKLYKVTILDENKFKLSDAGTISTTTSLNFDKKIFENISSVGVGIHVFKYPDIKVEISNTVSIGNTNITPDYYKASAEVLVKGSISNVFIRNGGVGYGVSNIINYERQPVISLLTGSDASLSPVIIDGKITNVIVSNPGKNYTTPPELEVVGVGGTIGEFAKLRSIVGTGVSEGKIIGVKIINQGAGYDKFNTIINIVPAGKDDLYKADIFEWNINAVQRHDAVLNSDNLEMIQEKSNYPNAGNKVCSFYPPQKYREYLNDDNSATEHSKIIGWAYDGNPIYGPISVKSTGIGLTFMQSSYELDVITDFTIRPPQSNYPFGYFTNDYVYNSKGDLDEYNGKFVINNDFPNGTYAYFTTIDNTILKPVFPYTTLLHRNATDDFNYDLFKTQSDTVLNSGDYKRNVTHLGINEKTRRYPLLSDSINSDVLLKVDGIKSSNIKNIEIEESGTNYKVGDQLKFNDPTITARVSEILGKSIVSVGTTNTIVDNLKFSIIDNEITGLSTIPHGLSSGNIVEITGISSTLYKDIEGVRTISVETLTSATTENIDTSDVGITTFVSFFDSTLSRKFKINDVIQIGSEQLLIIDHDDVNNRHRVIRGHNSTVPSAHNSGSIVTRLETKFTYPIEKTLVSKNFDLPKVKYFEGLKSVGIGTTVTKVAVGRVGTNPGIGTIFKSIPPKAIYLPNHDFENGEEVSLVSLGSTIIGSSNIDLSNSFDLEIFDTFFCVKLSSEYIGLSTQKDRVGFNTSHIFFKEVLTTAGDNNKIETLSDNITGKLRRVNGKVVVSTSTTTGQQHGLSIGDEFRLNITSDRIQTFDFKFNETIRKLVVNPVSFESTDIGVGTISSKITINEHDFETGDVVVYNSSNPATPLVDNGVYYVIKDSIDTIRLAENASDLIVTPYNYIGIGTTGAPTHQISKINPKLKFYKNSKIEFLTSDSSLTDFDIDFYTDENFISQLTSNLISRSGINGDGDSETKTIISVGSPLPSKFYYRIQGREDNFTKTLSNFTNDDVPNNSEIVILDSEFNNPFKVVGIGTTTIEFNPTGIAETNLYQSSGLSSAFYSTKSTGEIGGIFKIDILNRGFESTKLPILTSIASTQGSNAILKIESNDIGTVNSTRVLDQGGEFSPDKTLKPKADSNVILELKNVFTLKSIGISSGGRNYTTPPKVIVVENPNIVTRTSINGSSVRNVDILSNDSGLTKDVRVIPTINSNGVVVTQAQTNNFGTVTLSLRAPNADYSSEGSGFYNQGGSFPFKEGDEIFVENVKITDDADGYNSSDYDYKFFTVTGINTEGGVETVSYSLVGLGSTGGTYQQDNNFGRVIKKDDLAVFKPEFEKISFFENELITVTGKDVSGIVAERGWDSEAQTLKVFDVKGNFERNDDIFGSSSNSKSKVTNQFKFNFDLDVSSTAKKENNWKTNIGILNSNIQKLHDNDYYQRFAYSIKGEVPYLTWKNSVDSLAHISGFKNFSDLGIHSEGKQILKSDASLGLNVNIENEASVHEEYSYDLVSENTDDPNLSKLVTFNSKILTDYNESVTNKVLLIDDISPQFTGIVTTIGGGVIGISSFNLTINGESLFHKTFDPATGVNTTTSHNIQIPNHQFNTGEELIYKPFNNQPIGIATTSVTGIGLTDLLPSTVFAIREDNNTIKVAVAASFANSGIGVSFTRGTGIGHTHSFSASPVNSSIRALISIDNVIQSPVGVTTAISVGLATTVGVGSTSIFLNDISDISGKSLLRIEDEILKVNLVGVGSTNSLSVERGQMGTVATAHTVGAGITVLKGDYRIKEGVIYFTEAPYGPTGISGITTFSTFSGRAYYRLDYSTNAIIDDISDRFDGSTDKFDLSTNGQQVIGIQSSFGAFLINNIFQKPFLNSQESAGTLDSSDYQLVGTGQTVDFTGTSGDKDLPRGGIINEFDVGIGSGYQSPRTALLSAVVSGLGTVQSVGIITGGAGYLNDPLVSIDSTNGVGAAISAFVTAGVVTSVVINNGGSGYLPTGISTGLSFVTVEPPSPYKNLPLTYVGGSPTQTGSGAEIDVVVGTGGSIISFDMTNRGIGYEIGDVLELASIPFQTGTATTTFKVTVRNKFQDKFSGWCFGQLIELDSFAPQFNGFRKTFLITRSLETTEYYSVVAKEGSGIILQNNFLIFVNDILQKPGVDYLFTSGTRFTFREAPRKGSTCKVYFYTGSAEDFNSVNIDETIKPGDELRLQAFGDVSGQESRVVYELIAAKTLETQTYYDVGISTDAEFDRPTVWRKQTEDMVIDGLKISKERNYLEPKISPISGIIKSVSPSDTKIYVKDSWSFHEIDGLESNQNDVTIVSLGSTPSVERIEGVTYEGDYGDIIGIGTITSGINTSGPAIFFDIRTSSNIYPQNTNAIQNDEREISGISTGDYFVIENTFFGSDSSGVTGIRTTTSGPEIIGVGTNFLDNVYFAEDIVSIGSSTVRVFSNVLSISGIITSSSPSYHTLGNYSWGFVNVSRNNKSKSFTFHNQNGISGINTSAQVIRTFGLKTKY